MKLLDKLQNKIKYNKKVMIFLLVLVIIGIVSGAFLSVILKNDDKQLVIENVKDFMTNINNINNIDILKNSLFINIILIIGIWILGISIIGMFIVIGLVFWKSFTLGFTISSFILTYNLKGILLSTAYIFPHIIINLLVIMYLGSYSLKFSILIIKCIFKKINLDLRKLIIIYLRVLLISSLLIIITSIYEAYLNPYILKIIVPILIK